MTESLTYEKAGVDVEKGNQFVQNIKPLVNKTTLPGVLGQLGGFGAFFELPKDEYEQPVMVSCTDGVGTKLKLAIELGIHHTIGIDCVAMSANDCVVSGAKPLWFLDYFATGKLDVEVATQVVRGICEGCMESGMSLIGGETAEMPGMYQSEDYDLAGFCVGVVEKSRIIDGHTISDGDVLVGLASSGLHSNGFSLARKVIEVAGVDLSLPFDRSTLGQALLTPTRLYVKSLTACANQSLFEGASHITGGGFGDNISRMLPKGLGAEIDLDSFELPAIMRWLKEHGNLSEKTMLSTFNCGVGMCIVVKPSNLERAMEVLEAHHEHAFVMGKIHLSNQPVTYKGRL